MPPKASKHDEVRYLDVHEDDELDEDQLRSWIAQTFLRAWAKRESFEERASLRSWLYRIATNAIPSSFTAFISQCPLLVVVCPPFESASHHKVGATHFQTAQ